MILTLGAHRFRIPFGEDELRRHAAIAHQPALDELEVPARLGVDHQHFHLAVDDTHRFRQFVAEDFLRPVGAGHADLHARDQILLPGDGVGFRRHEAEHLADVVPFFEIDGLRQHVFAIELHSEFDLGPRLEPFGPEADGDDRAIVDEQILLGLHIADLQLPERGAADAVNVQGDFEFAAAPGEFGQALAAGVLPAVGHQNDGGGEVGFIAVQQVEEAVDEGGLVVFAVDFVEPVRRAGIECRAPGTERGNFERSLAAELFQEIQPRVFERLLGDLETARFLGRVRRQCREIGRNRGVRCGQIVGHGDAVSVGDVGAEVLVQHALAVVDHHGHGAVATRRCLLHPRRPEEQKEDEA